VTRRINGLAGAAGNVTRRSPHSLASAGGRAVVTGSAHIGSGPTGSAGGSTDCEGHVRLSEVVSALSYALDITEGQPPGHAVRTCVIGMRLADVISLSDADRSALFYALLLKDLGCSS